MPHSHVPRSFTPVASQVRVCAGWRGYDPAMKHVATAQRTAPFAVVLESDAAQAAMMNLNPAEASGEFGNEHPKAEQWLYVISGSGVVRFGKRRRALTQGSLILIPRDEPHQIINTAKRGILRTLNFYMPPAYTKSGEVKRSVK
jgi:mannose-6-phosphate isomerase-like protein (cupin superfamily)